MTIALSENKLPVLLSNMVNETNNPHSKRIDSAINALEILLTSSGVLAMNIENNKYYLIYELYALARVLGRRYCACRLYKNNMPTGPIYIKPVELFTIE